jgi:hypothetical protein
METSFPTWKSSTANLNPVRSFESDVTKWKPDYLCTWKSSPPVSSWILLIRSATCPPEPRICHHDVMTAVEALNISPILLLKRPGERKRKKMTEIRGKKEKKERYINNMLK